jgi:hypothetical protein
MARIHINLPDNIVFSAELQVRVSDLSAGEMNRCGLDLFFKVTNKRTGLEVATAKMAMLFFDYGTRQTRSNPGCVQIGPERPARRKTGVTLRSQIRPIL